MGKEIRLKQEALVYSRGLSRISKQGTREGEEPTTYPTT